MRYYIDTEFNGTGGQLLSIALVREDGAHFYEVLHAHELVVPWVQEHVVPFYNQEPIERLQVVKKMQKFLRKDAGPHVFIADWPEDLVHFNAMLLRDHGKRNDPFQYACLLLNLAGFDTAKASDIPHNALADARALADFVEANLAGELHNMAPEDLALVQNACGMSAHP
ncbi:3'-5' exoribonuclease [Aurantiacibacter sp. D1-12]|uniref:3'-5' exoribonuclease n=1 Tax=Aurantiacibacter sp. D1-12 TaxID=2993658 RepID=UPI00237C67D4|nr:3'-5' exoribonuclease [Aurantiacibacter sp. D1-12]MDE1468244.1 3'-5' exoribonuclease [Aurantiacibacter sp. D1-12]